MELIFIGITGFVVGYIFISFVLHYSNKSKNNKFDYTYVKIKKLIDEAEELEDIVLVFENTRLLTAYMKTIGDGNKVEEIQALIAIKIQEIKNKTKKEIT